MTEHKQRRYRLKNANRKPEVDLQNLINDDAKLFAQIRHDRRIEEGHLWGKLFENSRTLRRSLTSLPKEAVVSGEISLDRTWFTPLPELLPSEYTRQFIIFKVKTSLRLFGNNKNVERRPRYTDLYRRQREPREKNAQNVAELLERCRNEADLKTRRNVVLEQMTQRDNTRMYGVQQLRHRGSIVKAEQTTLGFPAKKQRSTLDRSKSASTERSRGGYTWLPQIHGGDLTARRQDMQQGAVPFDKK